MLMQTIALMSLMFLGFVGMIVVARILRISRRKGATKFERRCVCGYLLEGLEVPRCPECGTLVGFAKGTTAEDLGLTEEEMREAAMRKRLRKGMGEGN